MTDDYFDPCSWCGGTGDNDAHTTECRGGCCVHCQGTGREDGTSCDPPPTCVTDEDLVNTDWRREGTAPLVAPAAAETPRGEAASAVREHLRMQAAWAWPSSAPFGAPSATERPWGEASLAALAHLRAAAARVVAAQSSCRQAADEHALAHGSLVSRHEAGATAEELEPLAVTHLRAEVRLRDASREVLASIGALAAALAAETGTEG